MKTLTDFKNVVPALSFGWSANKICLVFLNMLIGSVLIILSYMGALTIDPIDFLFFSFVGFLLALYRPGWAFLLFVGMLPYENINIAPESFGLQLRPYQWLVVLVALALLVRLLFKRFPLEKFVPNVWDILLLIFTLSAFISALISTDQGAMKQSVILLSFLLLYFVCRIFVRSLDDVRMLLPFIFSSLLVVACYAIIQNVLFLSGKESLEVMAGRPNATFTEADWLGGYLAVLVATLTALIVSPSLVAKYISLRKARILFSLLLFIGFLALIITVSRSAWLAAFVGIILALGIFAWQRGLFDAFRFWNRYVLTRALLLKLFIAIPFLTALLLIAVTGLTPFDLFDRGKSLTSGEQKITIACRQEIALPERIEHLTELAPYDCEHIRLEERAEQQANGSYITEIFRTDPNVSIRQDIYGKTIGILKEHWWSGIGFGVISDSLGTDGRGAGLNASNIFLEIWLGTGMIGFIAFVIFWLGLGWKHFSLAIKKHSSLALVLTAVWVCVTVFNLFNSGLFLGWLFFFLACLAMNDQETYE